MTPSLVVLAAVLGTALASMPIFALATRGRLDPDAARKGSSFLLGIGNFLVHWLMWAIGPLERALLRAGAGPDAMNAAGLAFGLLSGILIGTGRLEWGGWAIAAAGIADILDGRLARTLQLGLAVRQVRGRDARPLRRDVRVPGLRVYFAAWPFGPLVVAAGLGFSLLVSYAQARGETVGVSGSGGLIQRAERLTLQILGCLFDPLLSLHDPRRRDELHRSRDLLGRLDRPDPTTDDSELGTHGYIGDGASELPSGPAFSPNSARRCSGVFSTSSAMSSCTDDMRSQPTSGLTSSGGVVSPSEFGEQLAKRQIRHHRAPTFVRLGDYGGSFRLRMFLAECRALWTERPDVVAYMQFSPSLLNNIPRRPAIAFFSCYMPRGYQGREADITTLAFRRIDRAALANFSLDSTRRIMMGRR